MKTAIQQHIRWMEKQYKDCQPFAPAIPFIQMAINNAKELQAKEIGAATYCACPKPVSDSYDPTMCNICGKDFL